MEMNYRFDYSGFLGRILVIQRLVKLNASMKIYIRRIQETHLGQLRIQVYNRLANEREKKEIGPI